MGKNIVKHGMLLAGLLLNLSGADAESYNCDGVISNRPCPETFRIQKLIVDDEPEQVPTPVVSTESQTVHPTPNPALPPAPVNGNYQVRTRNMKRPDPIMDWRVERADRFSTKFSGKITGSGEVEIAVVIIERQDNGSMKYRPLQSVKYHLPDEGGTKNFDFKVHTLAPQMVWVLEAKNKGRWQGYYDLAGCCPNKRAKAKCESDGVVMCGGTASTACRCAQ